MSITVGEKLITLRGARTREEVATAVGVSYNAIMMYENNYRIPKDDIKIRLAHFFNVPVGDLFFSFDNHKS